MMARTGAGLWVRAVRSGGGSGEMRVRRSLPPSRSDLNAWIAWVPGIRANDFMSSPICTGCMADLGRPTPVQFPVDAWATCRPETVRSSSVVQ